LIKNRVRTPASSRSINWLSAPRFPAPRSTGAATSRPQAAR
jgi:hypothetical protein